MVLSKFPDGTGRGGDLAAVVLHLPIVQEAEASKRVTNPKATRRRREYCIHGRRKELIARRGVKALEAPTIKTKQSSRTAKPEITVTSLCQRVYVFRRPVAEGPGLLENPLASEAPCLGQHPRVHKRDERKEQNEPNSAE